MAAAKAAPPGADDGQVVLAARGEKRSFLGGTGLEVPLDVTGLSDGVGQNGRVAVEVGAGPATTEIGLDLGGPGRLQGCGHRCLAVTTRHALDGDLDSGHQLSFGVASMTRQHAIWASLASRNRLAWASREPTLRRLVTR